MYVKKCDRCGKIYGGNELLNNEFKNLYNSLSESCPRWKLGIDFREECYKEFTQWMAEGAGNESV